MPFRENTPEAALQFDVWTIETNSPSSIPVYHALVTMPGIGRAKLLADGEIDFRFRGTVPGIPEQAERLFINSTGMAFGFPISQQLELHARACNASSMRTTVEMKPEHRSALLALAARRGEKGFSNLLAEAIDEFLKGEAERRQRRDDVLALAGSLGPEEAEDLRETTRALRENWR
jgi:hypothetical protein